MFEKASRMKLRLHTPRGPLSVEDLWDLPLADDPFSLDELAKMHREAIERSSGKSFVHKDEEPDEALQLQFDIIKHIIDVRLAERDAAENAALRAQRKQRVLEIMAEKQDEELKSKSLEELTELIETL